MPRAPRKKSAPRRRRVLRPRRRVPRAPAAQWAAASQTISLTPDAMNQVFRLDDVNLKQFDRLSAIGQCYQFFRFNRVEVKFKPLMDTFTDSQVQSVPYLHYLIMKGDTIDTGSFNKLRDAGAKPIRFDDKTITVNYKPAVLRGVIGEDTQNATNPSLTAWAEHKSSPWLATTYLPASESIAWQPSMVPHKGILYGVEMDNSQSTKYYDVTVTVYAEYKKPIGYGTSGADVSANQRPVIDKADVV